jgi:hypothetical protein
MVNIGNYDLSGIVRTISYWHKGSAAQWRRGIMFIFLLAQSTLVHFFCLPKRNEPKKRAATNLFWDYHFFGCPRITTRSLCSLKQ